MPRPIGTIDMHRGRWRVRLTLALRLATAVLRERAEAMLEESVG